MLDMGILVSWLEAVADDQSKPPLLVLLFSIHKVRSDSWTIDHSDPDKAFEKAASPTLMQAIDPVALDGNGNPDLA